MVITTARLKFVLWSTTAALSLAAVAVLAAGISLPLDVPAVEPALPGAARNPATTAPALPPLASFESAWKTDLRRPLVDPAPSAVLAKAGPSAQSPAVRLVGTVASGGRRRGLFMTRGGKVELRAAGETVGGANVVSVNEKTATLSFNGQTSTLNVEPAAPAGAPPAVRQPGRIPTTPSARGADADS